MKIFHEESNLEKSEPIQKNTIDLTLEHKSGENVLHKLSVVFIVQSNKAVSRDKKSDQLKFHSVVIHSNKDQKLWMVRLQYI